MAAAGSFYVPGTRVVCTKDNTRMGLVAGVEGTVLRGADYWPGLDAGCFDIAPDSYPAASPYGHGALAYWTADQAAEFWRVVTG